MCSVIDLYPTRSEILHTKIIRVKIKATCNHLWYGRSLWNFLTFYLYYVLVIRVFLTLSFGYRWSSISMGICMKTARNSYTFPTNLYNSIIYINYIYIHVYICVYVHMHTGADPGGGAREPAAGEGEGGYF